MIFEKPKNWQILHEFDFLSKVLEFVMRPMRKHNMLSCYPRIQCTHSSKLTQQQTELPFIPKPPCHQATVSGLSEQSPWASPHEVHLFFGFHSLHSFRIDSPLLPWKMFHSPMLLRKMRNNRRMKFINNSCPLHNVIDWISLWALSEIHWVVHCSFSRTGS